MDRILPTSATDTSVYTDVQGLSRIKALGRRDEEAALAEVARQFEAIFIQMMLGTMREASMGDELFDSDEAGMYRDMFDKQISLNLASGRGIGLAEQMVAQMRRAGSPADAAQPAPTPPLTMPGAVGTDANQPPMPLNRPGAPFPVLNEPKFDSPLSFVHAMLPHAQQAANELGIEPHVLVAQAALETGWGKSIPTRADGTTSFNVFGVKAGKSWTGDAVEARTTEFTHGRMVPTQDQFRGYESFTDAFNDYVKLIRTNPRFQSALGAGPEFINLLQQGGYATDPDYAAKINRILDGDVMRALRADFKA